MSPVATFVSCCVGILTLALAVVGTVKLLPTLRYFKKKACLKSTRYACDGLRKELTKKDRGIEWSKLRLVILNNGKDVPYNKYPPNWLILHDKGVDFEPLLWQFKKLQSIGFVREVSKTDDDVRAFKISEEFAAYLLDN